MDDTYEPKSDLASKDVSARCITMSWCVDAGYSNEARRRRMVPLPPEGGEDKRIGSRNESRRAIVRNAFFAAEVEINWSEIFEGLGCFKSRIPSTSATRELDYDSAAAMHQKRDKRTLILSTLAG